MSDSSNEADVTLAKQIARRAVARHERKTAAKLNAAAIHVAELQNALNVARQTLSEQSVELTDASEAVSLLQKRCACLERERDDARADASYAVRNFDQVLNGLRAVQDNEFPHVVEAVRRWCNK